MHYLIGVWETKAAAKSKGSVVEVPLHNLSAVGGGVHPSLPFQVFAFEAADDWAALKELSALFRPDDRRPILGLTTLGQCHVSDRIAAAWENRVEKEKRECAGNPRAHPIRWTHGRPEHWARYGWVRDHKYPGYVCSVMDWYYCRSTWETFVKLVGRDVAEYAARWR